MQRFANLINLYFIHSRTKTGNFLIAENKNTKLLYELHNKLKNAYWCQKQYFIYFESWH